jgi:competence protein ComEC
MRAMISACLALPLLLAPFVAAQAPTAGTLDLYVIDVEGGNAQLYVSPSGESVLIDSGNGGAGAARDAARIMAAVKDRGLTRIDHLITTHFHGDHVGGLPELATHIPIQEFIDHGANVQPGAQIDAVLQQYSQVYARARHTTAKPGDRVSVGGVDWRIVTSGGNVLTTSLPGAGRPNPYCATFTPHQTNPVSGDPLATPRTSNRSEAT